MFDVFKIINFIKKQFDLKDLLIVTAILTLFFFTRLTNITALPIFGDEGIYIRWAKTAWQDANWRFISLTDGRQPLQTWLTIPFLKLFPENPLLAGRLFGVLSGLIALIGIFLCLFYIFNKRTAYLGTLLYIITPYFLFYDRMALADSMVNAGFIWLFFCSILIWKTLRIDTSLLFGLTAGFFMLAKSSMRLAIINSITAPVLSLALFKKNKSKYFNKIINYYILIVISSILALIIYNIQRLSPFFHFVSQKNLTFVMSFEEFKTQPFAYFFSNIKLIPNYIFSETTIFFGIIAILGFLKMFLNNKENIALYTIFWIIIPLSAIAFFAKVLFPRYLLFTGGLLLIPTSFYLNDLFAKNKSKLRLYFKLTVVLIFMFQTIKFDYAIIYDQINIPFPKVDKGQYIQGTTAGWGLKEILEYARQKSQEKNVIILAEGDFGVVGDQLEALKTVKDRKIHIKGYWPLNKEALIANQENLKDNYILIVLAHTQDIPQDWPVKLIKEYPKPISGQKITLLELQKTNDKLD
ncbi:MAG: hypothetical protein KatS3mg090_0622 [Patescibacteria group bacterium]|nr:MAG: hypothetical protein KatS3mg090_0622 [Patescibacteria group bacterium]